MVVHTYYNYRPLSFRSLTALLFHAVYNEETLARRYLADMAYILVRRQGVKGHEVKRFTDTLNDLYHFKKEDQRTGQEIIDYLLQKGGNG